MKTLYDLIRENSGGAATEEVYRSRTLSTNRAFDVPEVASIPIATSASAVRATFVIELTGADAEVMEGEVWDFYAEAECTNEAGQRVFWWSEIRAHSDDGNNRNGTQLMVDNRAFGIHPTFRNGMIHRETMHRFSAPITGIDPLYIKLVTWFVGSSASGSVDITASRGHFGFIRHRENVPIGS